MWSEVNGFGPYLQWLPLNLTWHWQEIFCDKSTSKNKMQTCQVCYNKCAAGSGVVGFCGYVNNCPLPPSIINDAISS